jgi:hypothetical protein
MTETMGAVSADTGTGAKRAPWGLADAFAAGVAFFVPLLFVAGFKVPSWGARWLALPLLAAGGLGVLPRLWRWSAPRRRARRAVLAASAFAVWVGASALFATDHTVAVWGRYPLGTGLVFFWAAVGAWAVGAAAAAGGAHRTARIEGALLAACLINALIAVLEKLADLSAYNLGLFQGRAPGLRQPRLPRGTVGRGVVAGRMPARWAEPASRARIARRQRGRPVGGGD